MAVVRRLKILLLLGGLVLMVIGFLHEHAMHLPMALRLFARDYYAATQAYNRLVNQGETITKRDVGFDVLSRLAFEGATRKSGDVTIAEFRRGNPLISFAGKGPEQGVEIIVRLQNGFEAKWWSPRLLSLLEQLGRKQLFFWAKILFGIGFMCAVLVMAMEIRRRPSVDR